MHGIDWIVLIATLLVIVCYGIFKSRNQKNLESYLLDSNSAKWYTVGLSVMATQASAITFLSTPGQAFADGMKFVQFYFGLPIAMVIICIYFIPRYKRLKVYTAYEFLEQRFDLNTRLLTSVLFLVQRGLAAGITIYAPAIVLSTVLDVELNYMVLLIGGLVVLYTVLGGTRAVNVTQRYQMMIIFVGLIIAFGIILNRLPDHISFMDSLEVGGINGKMEILDFSFNLNDRYTFWTGIIGGSFLALSYFGTDQSQVQRYLTGESVEQSRYGLLFNGLLKVPMQFFILLVGIMVFVFYQYNSAPLFFNTQVEKQMMVSDMGSEYESLQNEYRILESERQELMIASQSSALAPSSESRIISLNKDIQLVRNESKELIKATLPDAESNDKDYVFIHFILNNLPIGLIGLLLAVFFCAAMSSTASELNALASTSLIDIYKRTINPNLNDAGYVKMAKGLTIMWGVIAIGFASVASLFENLIQFVNIIGSLFYGTILGIFLVAFFFKRIGARAVFIAAIITEILIIYIYSEDMVAFLWLNLIGCVLVIVIGYILQMILPKQDQIKKASTI
jgi:Na+/proline symporter